MRAAGRGWCSRTAPVATAFFEAPDGFTARLSVTLPVTCDPQVVEHHLQHFAVEFRTWILLAAAELPGRSGP